VRPTAAAALRRAGCPVSGEKGGAPAAPEIRRGRGRMSPRHKHVTRALALAILAAGLGACANSRHNRESVQYSDEPVERLYNTGAAYMDRQRWPEAVAAFQEVERQHPYSSWARRAILMEAYAHYQANEYDPAIEAAQRFISLHPGNENAPYAYYLVSI